VEIRGWPQGWRPRRRAGQRRSEFPVVLALRTQMG
jgi:hypothetical protein